MLGQVWIINVLPTLQGVHTWRATALLLASYRGLPNYAEPSGRLPYIRVVAGAQNV